jgi:hypothetical protein
MEGKLRIKSGIGRTQVGGETMTPNTKITRGKSAIGLGKFSKNYEKSRSPSKGLKKLNVNVNVNLNNGNK